MASKGLFMLSLLVVLLVITTSTCHARLLKGFVLNNGDDHHNVLVATASVPGLNLAFPVRLFGPSSVHRPSGGIAEEKFRSLVLASLPKGTKRSSAPSKQHNDFNA
ncbi:hypothetical protein SOVF_186510 [Spinacia oleracea]|nr:hypothetical protein SOVF_186510 [Spinacia oleracea]